MSLSNSQNKHHLFAFLAMLLGSLMLILAIFTPFATATDSFREYLEEEPEEMYFEEVDMTNDDVLNLSLLEYAKLYSKTADMGISEDVSILCVILISAFILFAILTLMFSILRKAIPAIIFNLLVFAMLSLIKFDFSDRGVIANADYDYGISQVLCYIGIIVVLVGAIALLIFKTKSKNKIQN